MKAFLRSGLLRRRRSQPWEDLGEESSRLGEQQMQRLWGREKSGAVQETESKSGDWEKGGQGERLWGGGRKWSAARSYKTSGQH